MRMDSLGALQAVAHGDRWSTAVPRWRWAGRSLLVVLAVAAVARVAGGKNGGRSVGDGWPRFRRCWDSRLPALRLGLRVDGTRHTCPVAPPQRLVLVGFYRYVRTPCTWASQRGGSGCGLCSETATSSDCCRHGGCPRRASVRVSEHNPQPDPPAAKAQVHGVPHVAVETTSTNRCGGATGAGVPRPVTRSPDAAQGNRESQHDEARPAIANVLRRHFHPQPEPLRQQPEHKEKNARHRQRGDRR